VFAFVHGRVSDLFFVFQKHTKKRIVDYVTIVRENVCRPMDARTVKRFARSTAFLIWFFPGPEILRQ